MSLKEKLGSFEVPAVMAFGNPLLDLIVSTDGNELLEKYNLKADGSIEFEEGRMEELLADISSESKSKTSPGGCALNTMRILQCLCGGANNPRVGVYYGTLGKDERGKTVKRLVQSAGVDARYAIHPTLPTGISVSITNNGCRSLVANIGAAAVYTLDDLKKAELPLDTIKIIYIEGFFITHSFDVVKEAVRIAQEKDIIIAFNLSGLYIFKDHQSALCEMVGIAKIVFGNAEEMTALANLLDLPFKNVMNIPFLLNNLKNVAIDMSSVSKDWLSNDVIFVMTQGGKNDNIVVWGQGQYALVSPIVPSAPIVDTTGAGDSFVAGFLAGILAKRDPKTCLEWGCKVASIVITRLGVTLPDDLSSDFLQ